MKKIKYSKYITAFIRFVFFFAFPAIFATAFSGVKYIFIQIGTEKSVGWNPFLVTLIAVVLFTIVFGRFFCGFVCSFGTYGDFIYGISSIVRKKMKRKPFKLPIAISKKLRYLKYFLLAVILVGCVYMKSDWIGGYSPWTIFSRLQAGKIPALGLGFVWLVMITIGMIFEERFFCRFLCPMGAVFSLLPVIPVSAIRRDRSNCINGCRACQIKCPADLEIANSAQVDHSSMGECFSCGACVGICPKGNVHNGFVTEKKHVLPWNVVRAVLFGLIFGLLTVWQTF